MSQSSPTAVEDFAYLEDQTEILQLVRQTIFKSFKELKSRSKALANRLRVTIAELAPAPEPHPILLPYRKRIVCECSIRGRAVQPALNIRFGHRAPQLFCHSCLCVCLSEKYTQSHATRSMTKRTPVWTVSTGHPPPPTFTPNPTKQTEMFVPKNIGRYTSKQWPFLSRR